MDRNGFRLYVMEQYGVRPDCPWPEYPSNEVFRHGGSRKWFALVMQVPRAKLGLEGEGDIDVVNLKCHPAMIGTITDESGIFPAYHMSKAHWVSAALDGSADEETLLALLDMSFSMTAEKKKRREGGA